MRFILLCAMLTTSLVWGGSTNGTMWGGTIQRTGNYPTAGVGVAPDVLWKRQFTTPIATTPAASTTLVYVATTDGKFYALDRTTGATVWKKQLIAPTYGSPAVSEASNRVFVSDGTGLRAFVASTGAAVWDFPTAGPALSSAGADTAVVYLGTNSGSVIAIDEVTGLMVWETNLGAAVTASVAIDPVSARVFSADHLGNIFALDSGTGVVDWVIPADVIAGIRIDAPMDTTPAFDPTGIVSVSGLGNVMQLDPTTGGLMWKVDSESRTGGSPSIAHGNVYACIALQSISALDPVDGSEVWRFKADSNLAARSVANTGGLTDSVYVASVLGTLYALDPTDGSVRWQFRANGGFFSDVAVSDGDIFAGTVAGTLYALTEP